MQMPGKCKRGNVDDSVHGFQSTLRPRQFKVSAWIHPISEEFKEMINKILAKKITRFFQVQNSGCHA